MRDVRCLRDGRRQPCGGPVRLTDIRFLPWTYGQVTYDEAEAQP